MREIYQFVFAIIIVSTALVIAGWSIIWFVITMLFAALMHVLSTFG